MDSNISSLPRDLHRPTLSDDRLELGPVALPEHP